MLSSVVLSLALQFSLQYFSIELAIMVTAQASMMLRIGPECLQEQLSIVQTVLWLRSCTSTIRLLDLHPTTILSELRHT